jgi:hypothetical protein
VVIDGRNDLYGDEIGVRFYTALTGDPAYAVDPDLNAAGVVLLQKPFAIASVVKADARFQLVYEDPIAVVLVRREGAEWK